MLIFLDMVICENHLIVIFRGGFQLDTRPLAKEILVVLYLNGVGKS